MNPADMFDILKEHQAYGEADPTELPDDVDDLLHLRNLLTDLVRVVYSLRDVVDGKAAKLIGPGVEYEYGDKVVKWAHSYQWKAIPDVTAAFVESAVHADPSHAETLFNMNQIRKTGVEKVAVFMGLDPEVAVQTILEKVWKPEPGLQFKEKK